MAAPQNQQRWLFGPAVDLLLGCGVAYLFVFAALAVWGLRLEAAVPATLLPIAFLFASAAHYGATLLRVYEQREDRQAYRLFTVWLTLAIGLLCYASLHLHLLGRVLVTIYLAWSPWHYAGQNYGLALMFMRRRGVEITPLAKRLFYASFILSVVLAVLTMHGPRPVYWLSGLAEPEGLTTLPPVFAPLSLGIPPALQAGLLIAGLLAYAGTLLGAAFLFLRRGSPRDLLPAGALVLTQSLWFVVPTTLDFFAIAQGSIQLGALDQNFAFFFVATGHAVQYLWVTAYYAQRSSRERRVAPYLLKCFLAGNAIWAVPALLFAPGVLGTVPYGEGLSLLVAAGVNLHHFVLDGAIWKLRDSRISRVLIRSEPAGAPAPLQPQRSFLRPAIWAAGALGFLIAVADGWEQEVGFKQALARQDGARLETARDRLLWIGRDDPHLRAQLAKRAIERGDVDGALVEISRSLQLRTHPKSLYLAGVILEEQGKLEEASQVYEVARSLAPADLPTLERLARVHALLGRSEAALEVYEAASRLFPNDFELHEELRRTRELVARTRRSDKS